MLAGDRHGPTGGPAVGGGVKDADLDHLQVGQGFPDLVLRPAKERGDRGGVVRVCQRRPGHIGLQPEGRGLAQVAEGDLRVQRLQGDLAVGVGLDHRAHGLDLDGGAGAPLGHVLPGHDLQHVLVGQVAEDQADPGIFAVASSGGPPISDGCRSARRARHRFVLANLQQFEGPVRE
jgi:hypothetical protein